MYFVRSTGNIASYALAARAINSNHCEINGRVMLISVVCGWVGSMPRQQVSLKLRLHRLSCTRLHYIKSVESVHSRQRGRSFTHPNRLLRCYVIIVITVTWIRETSVPSGTKNFYFAIIYLH